MRNFRIVSRTGGVELGVYAGETALHAVAAMQRDAGYHARVQDGRLVSDSPAGADLSDLAVMEVEVPVVPEHP